MTSHTAVLKTKLASLSLSLAEFEDALEPLFLKSFPETLLALDDNPIQKAKLTTLIPYLVYDLIFIYLKSKGIDPKTHPVVAELDRIKTYFLKIQNAENPQTKRTEIDKAAASRFIKHAISQAQLQADSQGKWKKTAAEEDQDGPDSDDETPAAGPSGSRASGLKASPSIQQSVPVKVTSKMLARAAYEADVKALDAQSDEEGDELQVFESDDDNDDEEGEGDNMTVEPTVKWSSKGKAKAQNLEEIPSAPGLRLSSKASTSGKKRGRAAIDPFTGLEEDPSAASSNTSPKKKKSRSSDAANLQGSSAPQKQSDDGIEKKKSRKSKKKEKH